MHKLISDSDLINPKRILLLTVAGARKAFAVNALTECGVWLVSADRYAAERAVILRLAVVLTFVYRTFNAVVSCAAVAVHNTCLRIVNICGDMIVSYTNNKSCRSGYCIPNGVQYA